MNHVKVGKVDGEGRYVRNEGVSLEWLVNTHNIVWNGNTSEHFRVCACVCVCPAPP